MAVVKLSKDELEKVIMVLDSWDGWIKDEKRSATDEEMDAVLAIRDKYKTAVELTFKK